MAIGSAVNDFVSSIYGLFASVLGGVYNIFHTVFAAVFGLFSGFVNLIADVLKGGIDVVGGLGKFVASKFCPTFPRITTPTPIPTVGDGGRERQYGLPFALCIICLVSAFVLMPRYLDTLI